MMVLVVWLIGFVRGRDSSCDVRLYVMWVAVVSGVVVYEFG